MFKKIFLAISMGLVFSLSGCGDGLGGDSSGGGTSSTDTTASNIQVIDGKLIMKTVAHAVNANHNISKFSIDTEEDSNNLLGKANNKFISLEGDVNLLEASVIGNARSRMQLFVVLKSESDSNHLQKARHYWRSLL